MHILPEMSIYKRYSDETKCMYFMIKDGKIFDKYYLKAEKRFNTKESFQCFYIPVTLFDSMYGKGGNYYPKVFLEKFIHAFFSEKYKKFRFLGLWKFLLKNR